VEESLFCADPTTWKGHGA